MELEVRHLRALCAIADAGSLHKAARQLGMSQPSLTTQLRRIENSLGAELFSRERTGCRPTPLGRSVVSRARPLLSGMAALVAEARAAADLTGGPRLRIGSTASRALVGWLRRLRRRLPGTDISLQMDVSANALLRTVAAGQLDVAFVHEVEGCPLTVPEGLEMRVLVEREPQFISLARDHPAAASAVVELADLAGDRWMVDPTVDGEWDGVRRVLGAAGLNPPVLHGDYQTAASLIAVGGAVAPCQPTSRPREDMVIRPLRDDPLAVRLLLFSRPGAGGEHRPGAAVERGERGTGRGSGSEDRPASDGGPGPEDRPGSENRPGSEGRSGSEGSPGSEGRSAAPAGSSAELPVLDERVSIGAEVFPDLEEAYREAALGAVDYRLWLMRNKSPLLHAPAA